MKTDQELVLDYCKDITLHNNHVLVCIEGNVTTLQLNTLISEKGADNAKVTEKFFKDLAKNPKTIVKCSDKVIKDYPNLNFGDYIKFNDYGNPSAIFVETDPYELDNVIQNFKHDSKDKSFNMNTIGHNYKVRCYYTYEASAIILTKKL